MGYITSIGTANPSHKIDQSKIADFMIRAMQLDKTGARKLGAIFKSSGIHHRYSVLHDYARTSDFDFYPNTSDVEPFPSTEKRLQAFREFALPLSQQAVQNAVDKLPDFNLSGITHLVTVCCTGMYAPGLDIDLVKALDLSPRVQRTSINFMGCYAAINAIRNAEAFCKADPAAKVLIVCTELCSLHFQKQPSEDNLLANALFADGSAAVIMEATSSVFPALQPLHFYNDLLYEGEHDMAWTIGDLGFEMKLSSYIPDLISKGIGPLTNAFLHSVNKHMADIKFMAIHPGGKKILEAVEQTLNITRDQNKFAYAILNNFGNMSSPTILFVLQEIMKRIESKDNDEHVLSFAFGPGLTLESALFQIKTH